MNLEEFIEKIQEIFKQDSLTSLQRYDLQVIFNQYFISPDDVDDAAHLRGYEEGYDEGYEDGYADAMLESDNKEDESDDDQKNN